MSKQPKHTFYIPSAYDIREKEFYDNVPIDLKKVEKTNAKIEILFRGTPEPVEEIKEKISYEISEKDFQFNFGKYKGLTLAEIISQNPGYIIWVHENKIQGLQFHSEIIEYCQNKIPQKRFVSFKKY